MTSWAIQDGGRLSDEQSPTIHHYRKLLVAKIHGEVQGYQEHFGAGREASLVWVELSLVQSN
jgi:hypothetical protein